MPHAGQSPRLSAGTTIITNGRPGSRLSSPAGETLIQLASTYGLPPSTGAGAGEHRVERRVAAILGSYAEMMQSVSSHWDEQFTHTFEYQQERRAAMDKEQAEYWQRFEKRIEDSLAKQANDVDTFHKEQATRWQRFQEGIGEAFAKQAKNVDSLEMMMERLFAKQEKTTEHFESMTERLHTRQEMAIEKLFSKQERIVTEVADDVASHQKKIREVVKHDVTEAVTQHSSALSGMISSHMSSLKDDIIHMKGDLHSIKSSEECLRQVADRAHKFDQTLEQIQSLPDRVTAVLQGVERDVRKVQQTFELSSEHINALPATMKNLAKASVTCQNIVSVCDGEGGSDEGFLAQIKRCHEKLGNSEGFKSLIKFDSVFVEVFRQLQLVEQAIGNNSAGNPSTLLTEMMKNIKKVSEQCEKVVNDLGKDKDDGLLACISQCRATFKDMKQFEDSNDSLKAWKEIHSTLKAVREKIGDPDELLQPIKAAATGCSDVSKACRPFLDSQEELLEQISKATKCLGQVAKAENKVNVLEVTLDELNRGATKMEKMCSDSACESINAAVKSCQVVHKMANVVTEELIERLREVKKALEKNIWQDLPTMTDTLQKARDAADLFLRQVSSDSVARLPSEFKSKMEQVITERTDSVSQKFRQDFDQVSKAADLATQQIREIIHEASLKDLLGQATTKIQKVLTETNVSVQTFEGKITGHVNTFESKMVTHANAFESKMVTNAEAFEAKLATPLDAFQKKIEVTVLRVEEVVTKNLEPVISRIEDTLGHVQKTVGLVLRWGKGAATVAAGGLTSGVLTLVGVLQSSPK